MDGAVFALAVNTGLALLFALSFGIVAISYRQQRAARWFCMSYLVGMLTPISELAIRFGGWTDLFMVASYTSFLAGLLVTSGGLAALQGRRPNWGAIAAIFVAGMAVRYALWGGVRNTLPYELAFQFPFCVAALLLCVTVLRAERAGPLHIALAITAQLLATHFMAKPFLAVAYGSGATARAYSHSVYALFSQASTGILLTGIGLLVLLLVVQEAVTQSQREAETDLLSGIANRRGFERQAQAILARAARHEAPVAAVVFDLDHFKAINDTHGHAAGDQVIAAFAARLRRAAPQSAIVARIGGEEFAMLLDGSTAETAWLNAEAIRVGLADLPGDGLPAVTVSGGVAGWSAGETLTDLLRRADRTCYDAKNQGRDRICLDRNTTDEPRGNVVTLHGRRR